MIPRKTIKKTQEPEPITLQSYSFNFNQEPPEEALILTIDQKKVASLGGLVVLTGKPKARKTTFLHSFLGSAIVKKPIFSVYANLPTEKPGIILIDTEQSNYDLYKSMSRLGNLIGIPVDKLPDSNFKLFSTRTLDSLETIKLIDSILEANKDTGILAIDSLLDLVNDLNDIKEAKQAITKIKTWLDTYKITIITVIHQSKSTNFSLGHLGSFASRFCQSELSIEKNEDQTSTIQATYMRSDENFSPVTITMEPGTGTYKQVLNSKVPNLNDLDCRSLIEDLYKNKQAYTYKDLLAKLKEVYPGLSGYYIQNHLVPFLYETKLIVKHRTGILKNR